VSRVYILSVFRFSINRVCNSVVLLYVLAKINPFVTRDGKEKKIGFGKLYALGSNEIMRIISVI